MREGVSKESLQKYSDFTGFPVSFKGDRINTIIIGEYHELYGDHQVELIDALKPDKLLMEAFDGFIYDPTTSTLGCYNRRVYPGELTQTVDHLNQTNPGGLNRFLRLSDKHGFPILGCDLTEYEIDKMALFDFGLSQTQVLEMLESRTDWRELRYGRVKNQRNYLMNSLLLLHQGGLTTLTVAIMGYDHACYIEQNSSLSDYCIVTHVPKSVRQKLR